jgi:redox-sensing transcriptional repressor
MKQPPQVSISRLALYLRFLEDYLLEHGPNSTIKSTQLARFLNINPHQIRKDLSYFGKFGERGIGYRVEELKNKISQILGLDRNWRLCLCGMGNLGSALFAYRGFKQMRLSILAVFDSDHKKIGKVMKGVRIYSVESIPEVVKKFKIDIAVITAPSVAAQSIADKLARSGIKAILNFAPVKLNVPQRLKLRNVDLSTEFNYLTYFLSAQVQQ